MAKHVISMNIDDLTVGDLVAFEEATGEDLMETMKPVPERDPETGQIVTEEVDGKNRPRMTVKVSAKAYVGLLYVALKRDNPSITPAEVSAMKLSDFEFDMEEPDPNSSPEAEENDSA